VDGRAVLALAAVGAALGAPGPAAAAELVDVRQRAPSIAVEVRYATRDNFTGAPLPGYCDGRALLLPGAATRLARVQRSLRPRGLGLKVFDAYRPARASRAMVRWARRTGRDGLLSGGYIAGRSNHNLGTTVDLTLVRLGSGAELDMGTAYDAFTPRSATLRARGRVLRNRLALEDAMEALRFRNYRREWWHYDSLRPGPRRLDVPIGC
jgi:D-alanyl-D-alanine dipeptidase